MTGSNSLRGNPPPAHTMATIVQKYGGTSVADAEKIKNVARRIASARHRGDRVVAVVSAMGDTTDRLIELAGQVSSRPESRELDALLSTGEQMSCTLVAMALEVARTRRRQPQRRSGGHPHRLAVRQGPNRRRRGRTHPGRTWKMGGSWSSQASRVSRRTWT